MAGTSLPATEPIRLIPPMITIPTMIAMMIPVAILGTPKYPSVRPATLHDWNMFPPVKAEIMSVMQKKKPTILASGFQNPPFLPMTFSTTHIAPPWGLSASSVFRYIMVSVISTVLRAMPKNPTIHIQRSAPGPPAPIASATPPMLPRPTVAESAAESAWKWLIAPGSSGSS